jgi:phosphatidylglycerophosphate synthase
LINKNKDFDYKDTLKTHSDDTFLNFQHFLLFSSKQITKFLYHTSVTPHQVILFSMIIGVLSSIMIIQDSKIIVITGAVLLFYKNVLDKVDGSLARAKNMVSRRGRFYDSITDFMVSLSLFTAIGIKLNQTYHSFWVWVVCYVALIASMIQCSYFIYYEVAFIKQTGKNTINRLLENVTEEDTINEDKFTILLQRIFQIIYGWQDMMVFKTDKFFVDRIKNKYASFGESFINDIWYKDKPFLTLASPLCIGSHMVLIALAAIIGVFEYYIVLNLILWNLLLIFCVFYHYFHVKNILNCRKQ